jgi:hypothetical protein
MEKECCTSLLVFKESIIDQMKVKITEIFNLYKNIIHIKNILQVIAMLTNKILQCNYYGNSHYTKITN